MREPDRPPITPSLEANVRAAFAGPACAAGLSGERLLSALQELAPEVDVSLTNALSNAGFKQPHDESAAVLDWIDATFAHWNKHYSLAAPLQSLANELRPLAAAFAVTDDRFFIPGGHALHQLLDGVYLGFSGWQEDPRGASTGMVDNLRALIHKALEDFPSEPKVDSALVDLSAQSEAHATELTRLGPGLIEREWSSLGENATRFTVAAELNRILDSCEVPGSVARFIKSDWFQSGLLIAANHGLDSEDWRSYSDTTQLLAQAVQPVSAQDNSGQARLEHTIQHLPATLAKHLVSLQPDQDAIAGAVGLIEYALLRNIRGEDLGLLKADPITIEGQAAGPSPDPDSLKSLGLEPGAWFALETPEGVQRMRFAGALAENTQLLFMNFMGARALRKPFADTTQLIKSGEMTRLDIRDSFCLSMAAAVENRKQHGQTAAAEREKEIHEQETLDKEARATLAKQFSGEPTATATQTQVPDDLDSESYPTPTATNASTKDQAVATDKPFTSQTVVNLQIPMGTWLGFHDREPPMMAKVAVRDLEKDSYIFTNREGIKLRELTVAQLMALIERDMVDILDRKTNFRDTVTQMQQDQERLSARSV